MVAEVAATKELCSSVGTAVAPLGCAQMKNAKAKLVAPMIVNRISPSKARIAQPKTNEPMAAPTALRSNTEEPSITNFSRGELSAAFASEIAYTELLAAPKAAASMSNVVLMVALER